MSELEKFPSRQEFLALLWEEIINRSMDETWIDSEVRRSERRPGDAFADIGALLRRLIALGVSRRELSLLYRHASYEAVFATLYKMGDPGCSSPDMLFEDLLTADPSGSEGRPGSAPAVRG